MDVSISVLKEPRGFIRVLQLALAILAFATTAGFSTSISFEVKCNGNDNGKGSKEIDYHFGYPFQMTGQELHPPDCNGNDNEDEENDDSDNPIRLPFDFSNPAEFFVATGVVSFLYCIIILIVYIFCHQTYANNTRVPVVDLAISALLTVFWLAGSSAWAQGVIDLKYYMDPQNLFGLFQFCHPDDCEEESDGDYATLDVSLVFGFANFLIWLFSLWFIYKETVFHTPAIPATSETQNQTKGDGRV